MKLKPNQAWHFIRRYENGIDRLRDGSEAPPDGVWLEYSGPLVMCKSGLHFSRHPFDALNYAPGVILCLVAVGGTIIEGGDKGVCSRRKIIARKDATEGLRYFARMQALSVIHLYPGEPEDCVLDWLVGGDPAALSAVREAESAAREAAGAAESAAMSAARQQWADLVAEAFE